MVDRYKPVADVVVASVTAYNAAHPDGEYVKWEDYDALAARCAELASLIRDHNEGLALSCIAQAKSGHCKPYTSRGMQCPDCPKDWAIDAALPPTPGADRKLDELHQMDPDLAVGNCPACEGSPKGENVPCAVCGKDSSSPTPDGKP